jgi:hypothetical protein
MTQRVVTEGYSPDIDPIRTYVSSIQIDISNFAKVLVSSFIYWGMVESGIAVAVASLPTLWFFFKGGHWNFVVKTIRSIGESSASGIRLLRTRRSKPSIIDDDERSTRRRNVTGRSPAESQTELHMKAKNSLSPDREAFPMKSVVVKKSFVVEGV